MMTIIYIFYVDNFSTYSFNLNLHNNNHYLLGFKELLYNF